MTCPHCAHPDAECIISGFWKCPNRRCKNFVPPRQAKRPASSKTPKAGLLAAYTCTLGGNDQCSGEQSYLYDIDEVAGGVVCFFCQGRLRLNYSLGTGFP